MTAVRRAAFVLCAALASAATARPQISTIALQQRPAAEVAEVLKPLLAPQESVSGDGYTLILNVEPSRLDDLRATIATLDRAPRQLRISVRQQLATDDRMTRGGVVANVGDGRSRVIVGAPDAGSGASARYGGVGVYGADPQGRQRDSTEQTVLALEGRPAHIAVGLDAPIDGTCENGYGERQPCTEYRDVSTGFDVLARLDGTGVMLDVSPQAQHLTRNGMVAFAAAQTQLHGPLGQWIEVGGVVSSAGESEDDVLASTARRSRSARRIAIKVELVP